MDKLQNWLSTTPYAQYKLTIASADASFRKYYRLTDDKESVLVMDASLEKESLRPFLEVTKRLHQADVKAPQILEHNLEDGYLILEDFGSTHYLDLLNKNNFKSLYQDAIKLIVQMQNASAKSLPLYDKAFLLFEMNLMQEWYLQGLLKRSLTQEQKETLDTTLKYISEIVLSQPQGLFVHRDFHSRNIMLTAGKEIGVIDYQDAMSGAVTYDLVSLLKDCYIEFDEETISSLALEFKRAKNINVDDTTFLQWFDFMGLQRHIKVLGVFARLHLRDGKDGYLKDIPLVLKYTLHAAKKYPQTQALAKLLEEFTCEQ
ncbi:MAG: phosphotransferase [Campylobacterales bacterium]|nr:phosphotransferase [Campylobacterales bacterium]